MFVEKSKQAATENVEPTVEGVAVSAFFSTRVFSVADTVRGCYSLRQQLLSLPTSNSYHLIVAYSIQTYDGIAIRLYIFVEQRPCTTFLCPLILVQLHLGLGISQHLAPTLLRRRRRSTCRGNGTG